MTSHRLCFQVEDEDPENTILVFARSSIEAKRRFANEHDYPPGKIAGISAKRCPGWDQFAPGPVPALEMIEVGWYFECHGCYTRISRDDIGDPIWHGDYPPEPDAEIMEPVEPRPGAIFCCPACLARDTAERRRIALMTARAKAAAHAYVLRRWPGVTIKARPGTYDSHVYCARADGHLLIHNVTVSFEVPGMLHGGCHLRIDDDAWQKSQVERHGPLSRRDYHIGRCDTPSGWPKMRPPLSARTRTVELRCANGDAAVWQAWLSAQRQEAA